jgi:hypothetical protein
VQALVAEHPDHLLGVTDSQRRKLQPSRDDPVTTRTVRPVVTRR